MQQHFIRNLINHFLERVYSCFSREYTSKYFLFGMLPQNLCFFVSLLQTCYRHPSHITTRTPTSHPHVLAPYGFETQHRGNKLKAIPCSPSPFQLQHSQAAPETKFQVWSHFRCPVAWGRRSCHLLSCTFLPALGCLLPPPALQQLGCSRGSWFSSQPGRKKPSISPFR